METLRFFLFFFLLDLHKMLSVLQSFWMTEQEVKAGSGPDTVENKQNINTINTV